ncbi:TPA: hypothetical protein N0F65_010921 [Lagenidium giganteum]|uniref:Uncharacterized protein n=1 Tax=Lagenidium giganteum TaxID=4803 RepID=A0AAV2YVT9_9STRA|nr:TPA: hypothetical protein N0F65_010921 [Lagenidium giganteum]
MTYGPIHFGPSLDDAGNPVCSGGRCFVLNSTLSPTLKT